MIDRIDRAIRQFKAYARQHEDVSAIISFGSSSRTSQDEYSDLDLFIFTTQPQKYLDPQKGEWLASIGQVLSRVVVKDAVENILLNKIMMQDGFCVDVIVVDIAEFRKGKYYFLLKKYGLHTIFPKGMRAAIDANIYQFHYFLKRGYTIVYDKVNIQKMVDVVFDQYHGKKDDENIITAEKFQQNYNRFLQTCYKMNVKLLRNDFFYAIIRLDNVLKHSLIRFIEWRILIDKEIDVYYRGAKLKQWCEPSIVKSLYNIFPHSSTNEIRAAILNTMEVYLDTAYVLAAKYGYPLNKKLEEKVFTFLRQGETQKQRGAGNRAAEVARVFRSIAQKDEKIQAVVSFGSSAIKKNDAFADLDLYLFTTEPEQYFKKETWTKYFSDILSMFVRTGDGERLAMLMFEDGFCADIIVVNSRRFVKAKKYFWLKKNNLAGVLPGRAKRGIEKVMNTFHDSLKRGYEVLHDKVGIAKIIAQLFNHFHNKPVADTLTSQAFHRNYHQFWQTSYKMMIKLKREDFYYAIIVLDNLLKGYLMNMIEWQTQLRHPERDTFYNGSKIHQWCEEDLVKELWHCFPHKSITDMRLAMQRTMDVYKSVSHAVAARKGFELNAELEEMVYDFVTRGLPVAQNFDVKFAS
jgi:predicted nucleotidyltransferase